MSSRNRCDVITDLVQIRRLGETKRSGNEAFRKHLKRHGANERRLRRIAEQIEEQIDCTACANCCRVATARLTGRDIGRLARHLRITQERFLKDYAEYSEEESSWILRRNQGGCVFLQGNLCGVYEIRPAACDDFPHLVRGPGSLVSRMWEMPDRATYCPIAYNTLEAFKEYTGFPAGGR